jgi:hypothetical protein
MNPGAVPTRVFSVFWAGILGFLILAMCAGIWASLVAANLALSPSVPWAVPVMALVL